MSESINSCHFSGRLTRDCEAKTVGSQQMLRFSMAVMNREKVDGEWKDDAIFLNCELWGKRAEFFERQLLKGKLVFIEARMRVQRYNNKEGNKVEKTIFDVKEIGVNFEKAGSGQRTEAPADEFWKDPAATVVPAKSGSDFDEDIPF